MDEWWHKAPTSSYLSAALASAEWPRRYEKASYELRRREADGEIERRVGIH